MTWKDILTTEEPISYYLTKWIGKAGDIAEEGI